MLKKYCHLFIATWTVNYERSEFQSFLYNVYIVLHFSVCVIVVHSSVWFDVFVRDKEH